MHSSIQFGKDNNKKNKTNKINQTKCFGQAEEAKGSEVSGEADTEKELKEYSQKGGNDPNVE